MLPLYKTPTHVFNYDEIPPGYYYEKMLNGSPSQRFWHQHKFLKVAEKIKDGERVLDLGCGPGSFISILARSHPQVSVVGLDIASSQIEFARKFIEPQFGNRVSFKCYEPQSFDLPFESNQFDVVTSIEVIEHVHPYLAYRILQDAKRVLKANGKILLTTPNYRSFWPLLEWILEKVSPVKYHSQHINKFTPNSLVKFIESMGLELVSLETLFIISPFLAGIQPKIAKFILNLERKIRGRFGSLLISESKILKQF